MQDGERAQREAEHKAAALHQVGWETGAGATIWAQAVRDQLALHESAREQWGVDDRDREGWQRLHGSTLTLVVAIGQVLAFAGRVQSLRGDAELAQARDRVDSAYPDARMLP